MEFTDIQNRQNVLKDNIMKGFGNGTPLIEQEVIEKAIEEGLIQTFDQEGVKKFKLDVIEKAKKSLKGQDKFDKVMHEYGQGTLKSSDGKKIQDKEQALAVAFSEARKVNKTFEKDWRNIMDGADAECTKLIKANVLMKGGEKKEIFIRKGGEGSRGGNVIGHTSTGKPIYHKNASDEVYKNFTPKEHKEAALLHHSKAIAGGAYSSTHSNLRKEHFKKIVGSSISAAGKHLSEGGKENHKKIRDAKKAWKNAGYKDEAFKEALETSKKAHESDKKPIHRVEYSEKNKTHQVLRGDELVTDFHDKEEAQKHADKLNLKEETSKNDANQKK